MDSFDKYAHNYHELVTETPLVRKMYEYSILYKVQILKYLINKYLMKNTRGDSKAHINILDFGCGVGTHIPAIIRQIPGASITGADISAPSLAQAENNLGQLAHFIQTSSHLTEIPDNFYNTIFVSCVLHHVEPEQRAEILTLLKEKLTADGFILIFEHNPYNPITRYAVAHCKLDKNASLLPLHNLRKILRTLDYKNVTGFYTVFFPNFLSMLRKYEKLLAKIPIGAQYGIYGFKEA